MPERQRRQTDYRIAWVCALPLEAAAAQAMLDEVHPELPQLAHDQNVYTLGAVAGHNIVIACLPSGSYGTISAAVVMTQLLSTFTEVKFGLMVGVGGGIPRTIHNDMWLGDIVVSKPTSEGTSGVVAYDFGKVLGGGEFKVTGMLNRPSLVLLNAISQLQAEETMGKPLGILDLVSSALNMHPRMTSQYGKPERSSDRLFRAEYAHLQDQADCSKCDTRYLIDRPVRQSEEPRVHYGLIASGNRLIRDGVSRDRLAEKHGALCFEMEAAGLMNQLPSVVIRGICDYCDSHKSKHWQGYASLTAAAYAKILLSRIPQARRSDGSETPSPKPCFIVPFRQNPLFLGRERELSRLLVLITGGGSGTRRAAISGLGGVGKTQIVLELAYRLHKQPEPYSIIWISSTSAETVEQAFMDIGSQLGLEPITTESVKDRVKGYLDSDAAGPWVLIIDNADDPGLWSASMIRDSIPASPRGFTLFTTRNHQLAARVAGVNIVDVKEMDIQSAITLLKSAISDQSLLESDKATASLARHLHSIPLAIVQAASYINENLLLSKDFEDEWRYVEAANSITSTWFISFKQIQTLSSLAVEYLSFMSCLDFAWIPCSLLPTAQSKVEQQSALGVLKGYYFISERSESGSQYFSLHQLVHLVTKNWLRSQNTLEYWTKKAGQHLKDVFPESRPENRHILGHEQFQDRTPDREKLAQKVGQSLYSDGRYREAEVLFREVLETRRARLGHDHPDTLESLECVVATLWDQGRWKHVEELQLRLLRVREKRLGPDDPAVLSSLGNLASTLMNQGKWVDAQNLEKNVSAKFKMLLGEDHPKTLTSMSNLATTYRMKGQYSEAEELDVRVLKYRTKILGHEHPDTVMTMGNLACTYMEQGRWSEAEKLRTRQVALLEGTIGPEHKDTMAAMGNLATIYREQGKWKLAEDLEVRVWKQSQAVLGPEHPNTLISMANLASTYRNQNKLAEAELLELETTKIFKSVLGSKHPITLRSMGNLASTKRNQGKLEEAEELEKQVMTTFDSILGRAHPDTLTSMGNLACTYRYQGRYAEAEKLEIEVLDTRKKLLGQNHANTLTSMWNLARTWRRQGKYTGSLELLQTCVQQQIHQLGPGHPDTVEAMLELDSWQSSLDESWIPMKDVE
ncbi:hypothetical protein BDW67DRAFT_192467 [Aspergillus spinulosporus]